MSAFKVSVWSKSNDQRSKPLGKSYRLKNGKLIHEGVGTNAGHIQVVEVESLDDLVWIMEFDLYNGNGFITSGVPKKTAMTEAEVTYKDSPKIGCLSRSQSDIEWQAGTGTYFIVDYDPAWSLDKPKTAKAIRQDLIDALELAGVDISELQILAYKSSSSGFIRSSDNHSFDKGGRHLIFLVEDAGDLKRFEHALFVFTTLAGLGYGAVSNAGYFLERGIIDRAAVSATQPTFAGIPAYRKKGLTNVRETGCAHRLGGSKLALDTTSVRDPTDAEMAQYKGFWERERVRLQPEIRHKKRDWLAKQGHRLAKFMPKTSPEKIRRLLEHRWSGNLVGGDTIVLNRRPVTISDLLMNPYKYEGETGPDPIEPEYRGGAQTCKVFMNRTNGRPMIYSQAHGGVNYQLWYDADGAVSHLTSKSESEARDSAKTVIHATRVSDSTEVESLLRTLAKILKTTKEALSNNYQKVLTKNMLVESTINGGDDDSRSTGILGTSDFSHNAAQRLIIDEKDMHSDESQVWRYNGKYFEPASDRYLGNKLREILIDQGWDCRSGLTKNTRDAITALKELTYSQTPIIAREPKQILNFQNGELHFLTDGKVDFRKHDPSSGLTHVLSVEYDPTAKAILFQKTLEELFWPPLQERIRNRSKADKEAYEIAYRLNAISMREHVEELMAYLIIPARWIAAWFIWIGEGHNGKTFLTKILNLLLNASTIESDRLQSFSRDSFGMERLIGKTLLIDDDLDTNTTIPDGFVKKISESKPLSANRKYKTSLTFNNRCALLLLTNNYPRMTDISAGTTRRIHSLVFPRRFYSREEIEAMGDGELRQHAHQELADPSLIDRIEFELSGVVNVLVNAYQRLIRNDGFSLPNDVQESNEKLVQQSNPLPMFVTNHCDANAEHRLKTSEFANALRSWIDKEHIHWKPSNLQIRTMMGHRGYQVTTIHGYEHYVGLRLKDCTRRPEKRTESDSYKYDDDVDDWDDEDVDDWDDEDVDDVIQIH